MEDFRPGDTIRVHYKIIEGSKERIQPYEGIVISKKGSDVSKTFTVRRLGADNVGVERIFPLFSPNIEKIEVLKLGKVRRAKLYYLRDRVGRAATRIAERKPKTKVESAPKPEAKEEPKSEAKTATPKEAEAVVEKTK